MQRENIDEDYIAIFGGLIFFIIGIVLIIVASFFLLGGVGGLLPHQVLGIIFAYLPFLIIGILGIIKREYTWKSS